MSLALKKATFLTGLPPSQNARNRLLVLYDRIRKELRKMPEASLYRKYTEEIINERYSVVSAEENIEKIEEKIGHGQMEELLIQARNELTLARRILGFKIWEPMKDPVPTNQWKWPPNK